MKSSNREEIINHNAKELFDIVLDIESYPLFYSLVFCYESSF